MPRFLLIVLLLILTFPAFAQVPGARAEGFLYQQQELLETIQQAVKSGDAQKARELRAQFLSNEKQFLARRLQWRKDHPKEAARVLATQKAHPEMKKIRDALADAVQSGDETKVEELRAQIIKLMHINRRWRGIR